MNLHRERAFAAMEMERWELALTAVEDGLAEYPDCADLYAAAAHANSQIDRLDAALAAASRVVELEPEWDAGFRLLMDIYRRIGNEAIKNRDGRKAWELYEKAVQCGTEAVRLNPYRASTFADLSLITRAMGNRQEANELAVRAVETNPDDVAALEVYGRSHIKEGDKRTAEKAILRALELAPEEAALHLMLAELLLARNDFRGAYQAIRTSLLLDPTDDAAQKLFTRVLQTQSGFVRCMLRLHNYLIVNVLRRATALAVFLGSTVLLAFAAETFLPQDFKGVWALVMFLGFFTLVTLVAEPERLASFIWFFAKRVRAVDDLDRDAGCAEYLRFDDREPIP
jgi:tetratricopeptide (TPR) repeat protein